MMSRCHLTRRCTRRTQMAEAYAEWAGACSQRKRNGTARPTGTTVSVSVGRCPPNGLHGNFDFVDWDPVPVDAYAGGDSAYGVSQLIGNGWEWTSTPFKGFDGFEARPYYPGYSANFFDGEHYVLKGAHP